MPTKPEKVEICSGIPLSFLDPGHLCNGCRYKEHPKNFSSRDKDYELTVHEGMCPKGYVAVDEHVFYREFRLKK